MTRAFWLVCCGLFWTSAALAQESASLALQALRSIASHSALILGEAFLPELKQSALGASDPSDRECVAADALNRWRVFRRSENAIELYICGSNHSVAVNLYAVERGGYLAILEITDGVHHQMHQFEYYWLDKSLAFKREEKDKEKLGLRTVRWNEFVDGEPFKKEENYEALMFIDDDGVIRTEPWTWMEPAWENREPSKKIWFSWNGARFKKVVARVGEGG